MCVCLCLLLSFCGLPTPPILCYLTPALPAVHFPRLFSSVSLPHGYVQIPCRSARSGKAEVLGFHLPEKIGLLVNPFVKDKRIPQTIHGLVKFHWISKPSAFCSRGVPPRRLAPWLQLLPPTHHLQQSRSPRRRGRLLQTTVARAGFYYGGGRKVGNTFLSVLH